MKFILLCLLAPLLLAAPLAAMPAEEERQVELLLQELSAQPGLVFIRNGREHRLEEALYHLRRKLKHSAASLQSASQFIDQAASKSSLSGQPYLLRLPNGVTRPLGPYLHQLLKAIQAK